MTESARILLEAIRKMRREHIVPPPLGLEFLIWYLGITDEDIYDVGDILQADIREEVACSPDYAQVNDELRSLFPQRPSASEGNAQANQE